MAQSQGYPTEAAIATYLAAQGFEEITENNTTFMQEYRQALWRLLSRSEGAGVLSVYAATTTTFNIVAGKYLWNGEEKTYTAGANVNPTDTDTTYVWLDNANALQSVIDGTGWPATEHLKLAEVVVDGSGIITNIVDRRTVVQKTHGGGITSGITSGLVAVKHIATATLEALLDTVTNNVFAVNAGDTVLKIVFGVKTAAGGACLVDVGFDANADGSGADTNGWIILGNANTIGAYASDNANYDGTYGKESGRVVAANGFVTITSTTDQSASSFVGGCYMLYLPA